MHGKYMAVAICCVCGETMILSMRYHGSWPNEDQGSGSKDHFASTRPPSGSELRAVLCHSAWDPVQQPNGCSLVCMPCGAHVRPHWIQIGDLDSVNLVSVKDPNLEEQLLSLQTGLKMVTTHYYSIYLVKKQDLIWFPFNFLRKATRLGRDEKNESSQEIMAVIISIVWNESERYLLKNKVKWCACRYKNTWLSDAKTRLTGFFICHKLIQFLRLTFTNS